MMKLSDKKLFLLDMDGTIYLDQQLFDGTLDFLEYVKNVGGKAMYLTNNSSKSVDKYIEKLGKMGINAQKEDFMTSAQVTAVYLLKTHKNDLIYVFGTQALKDELSSCGLKITDVICDEIGCLVLGFDTELQFQKLEDACILLNRGVDYIATNPDWVCPTWYGSVPDCGSIAQILNNATNRLPKFIGKPEPTMIELAIEQSGFNKDEAIILGDRLYTDIASGSNAGIDTALMLSGESTLNDVETFDGAKPTYIFNNIRCFLNEILSEQNTK